MTGSTFAVLAAAALSMRVETPQPAVLVGEPVKLVVTWSTTKAVKARLTDPLPWLEILTDDGSGWKRFDLRYDQDNVVAPDELRSGQILVTEIVLVQGAYGNEEQVPLFSKQGEYSLRLRYHLNEKVEVASNAVAFNVSGPVGEEQEVYSIVKAHPGFLLTPQAEELSRRFPASRYLRIPAFRRLQKRLGSLLSRQDPDSKQMLWDLDRAQLHQMVGEHCRSMAAELLAAGDWGAFESDRLEKVADLLERAGALDGAEKARKEILERFPRSKAAQDVERARKEEEAMGKDPDDEPPARPNR